MISKQFLFNFYLKTLLIKFLFSVINYLLLKQLTNVLNYFNSNNKELISLKITQETYIINSTFVNSPDFNTFFLFIFIIICM